MSERDISDAPAEPVKAPEPAVDSPPAPKVAQGPLAAGRAQLAEMAQQVAKKGSRQMLWDYLRLRSRVMAAER